MKHKHRHIGRIPCDDGGRDWSPAATNQGMPRIVGKDQKLGKGVEHLLP